MARLRRESDFTEPRYDEVYEEFVNDFKEAEHKTSGHARDDRQIGIKYNYKPTLLPPALPIKRLTADPFEGVWDAMYVHECTRCGYLLSELKRRALQGSKLFLSSRCPRCDGDSWTEYKGLQPEPVRIYPSGVIWTDPKTGRDCLIRDPLVTKTYLNTLNNKLYTKAPDGSWTEAAGLKLVPYPGKIRRWFKSHQAYRIKRFIYGRPIERVARGAKKMEQWTKLAMAWIFIGTVLLTGLLAFGVLLVSLGLVIGITTTYRKLKTKIKSRLV
jgi:hypothetical protein